MDSQYPDVAALQSLKYFSLSSEGTLLLKKGVAEHIMDCHTHIGWGLSDDLVREPTEYVFPYTNAQIDLSHYSAHDFNPELIKHARLETVRVVLAKGRNYHCSASHLEKELQALRITSAIVLAVDIFGNINSDIVLESSAQKPEQFIPFISLHPRKKHKDILMKQYVKRGARGIKIHPPMQLVRPNGRFVQEIAELADYFSLPILFHCGHTPLSPRWQQKFTHIDDYEKIVQEFPNVTFILGHSGVDQFEKTASIGKKYPNVYLELSGQPPETIKKIISIMGDDRLLFGSDWPYYPTALPLAKVLLATEGKEKTREKLLYTNAFNLLNCLVK